MIPAIRALTIAGFGLLLGACATENRTAANTSVTRPTVDARYGVTASPRLVQEGRTVPRGGGTYRVGRPYTIAGRRYVPYAKREGHTEVGVASWYGRQFHGRLTANGEIYDMNALSAAHRTMPMPSYARVTNLRNGRSVVVRVNDRGPFAHNRVIDLSSRVSTLLDFKGQGLARVRVDYLGRAPLRGSDDRMLLATMRTDGSPAPRPTDVGGGTMVASAAPGFVPEAAGTTLSASPPLLSAPTSAPLPPLRPVTIAMSPSMPPQSAAAMPGVISGPPATAAIAPSAAVSQVTAFQPVPSQLTAPGPSRTIGLGSLY